MNNNYFNFFAMTTLQISVSDQNIAKQIERYLKNLTQDTSLNISYKILESNNRLDEDINFLQYNKSLNFLKEEPDLYEKY